MDNPEQQVATDNVTDDTIVEEPITFDDWLDFIPEPLDHPITEDWYFKHLVSTTYNNPDGIFFHDTGNVVVCDANGDIPQTPYSTPTPDDEWKFDANVENIPPSETVDETNETNEAER